MIKKYLFYLGRWQLSTPILAVVLLLLSSLHVTIATIIANLIGGLIFFWVDRFIFRIVSKTPLWEIQEETTCVDCGTFGTGFRIVEWRGYNRRKVENPQWRCDKCRKIKMEKISGNIGQ